MPGFTHRGILWYHCCCLLFISNLKKEPSMKETFFLHGLDSSGNGTKGQYFAMHFPQIKRPNFTGDLDERLEVFERLTEGQDNLTLIGSSFGGLMAACFAIKYPTRVTQLVLLAPALNYHYSPPAEKLPISTLAVIGRHDVVTPPAITGPLAEQSFSNLDLRLVDDDHLLHHTFQQLEWKKILGE
ncbi:alpha/beta fold hydrolase [Desulforhopalus vacuolatus]|uniref:alpha/beta fold hydrolase n=1 Tax=Desulforhopalus vacuolatus TaxID=40414 RepID=UPI001965FFCB|nr:alpha/beta fold hydrolase [Desulforhopalus vacuolatus]MBM9518224.1 alpha/beta fold hydrolase [Desulforhopalus vacuolatus]